MQKRVVKLCNELKTTATITKTMQREHQSVHRRLKMDSYKTKKNQVLFSHTASLSSLHYLLTKEAQAELLLIKAGRQRHSACKGTLPDAPCSLSTNEVMHEYREMQPSASDRPRGTVAYKN